MSTQSRLIGHGTKASAVFGVLGTAVAFIMPDSTGLAICAGAAIAYAVFGVSHDQLSSGKWEARAKRMFKGLSNPEYLRWQQQAVETLYSGLDFATAYGKNYPAAVIRPSPGVDYPFDSLCQLLDTNVPALELDAQQRAFLKMLAPRTKWPKMKGFALKRLRLDDQHRAGVVESVVCTFAHNLATSHILEWELHRLYEKRKNCQGMGAVELLNSLPRRYRYHAGRPGHLAVLEPVGAYPLLSVQAMVVFHDARIARSPEWRVVTARRSTEVVVKPGYFQFQPAGGFEVYGSEADDDAYLVKEGFNVLHSLLREYAEELFNARHLQVRPDSRDASSILAEPCVSDLLSFVEKGRAFIDFLGVVVDLVTLRHELSFLILIEDDSFCRNPLLGSWEAMNLSCNSPRELESVLSSGLLHGSSAALLELASENERLRMLGISRQLKGMSGVA